MSLFRLLASRRRCVAIFASSAQASAQGFTGAQRGEIENIIREYLIKHPEVLEEAIAELSKRQTAAEAAKQRDAENKPK